jgi:hypothetical protein
VTQKLLSVQVHKGFFSGKNYSVLRSHCDFEGKNTDFSNFLNFFKRPVRKKNIQKVCFVRIIVKLYTVNKYVMKIIANMYNFF